MVNIIERFIPKSKAGQFIFILAGFFSLELLSWLGWSYPVLGVILCCLIAIAWLWLAYKNLAVGIVLLLVELIVGSLGYLLSLKIGDQVYSIRLVLFLAALALLVWKIVINHKFVIWQYRGRARYLVVLIVIGWGVAVGLFRGNNFGDLFLDSNNYLYLLLFPLIIEAWLTDRKGIIKYTQLFITSALVWLSLKTILTLYFFSHVDAVNLFPYYQWWRQTGFGEITYVAGSFFRVFSQSQVFAALASLGLLYYLWQQIKDKVNYKKLFLPLVLTWINLVTLVASFSRSFWLGCIVTLTLLILIEFFRSEFKLWLGYILVVATLVLSAIGTILLITEISWPLVPIGATSAQVFSQRLGQGEAASESRLKLLPPLTKAILKNPILGSGLGTVVTYYSTDPRAVQFTAGQSGEKTTYAFEWGYLDMWLKFGLVGLLLFLGFIIRGLWPAALGFWQQTNTGVIFVMALTLLVINITTPYLNHPLGLGIIMMFLGYTSRVED